MVVEESGSRRKRSVNGVVCSPSALRFAMLSPAIMVGVSREREM